MTNRDPETPLLQLNGGRGFLFCGSDGKMKKMIAAKLGMRASKSTTSRRPQTENPQPVSFQAFKYRLYWKVISICIWFEMMQERLNLVIRLGEL